MTRYILRRNLTVFLLSFFALHSAVSAGGLYRSMAWVDMPVHFLAGVLSAAVFYWFFQRFPSHFDASRHFWITLLMVLGWGALVGVAWEFTEFIYDLLVAEYGLSLHTLQFGLRDTLGDLLFDILGALTLAIFVKLRYHNR
ncbi:MAG: hypothetical protein PHV43_00840 [Candidatus Colwellbacteria bacterium]|nr:hypothetical protein [Candidatus Colwellbacteria bacterium]